MQFQITISNPIMSFKDEFIDFLTVHSNSFSLAGHVKDIEKSKQNSMFRKLYQSILPYLIRQERKGHEIVYYFKIMKETVLWLKSQPDVLLLSKPLHRLSFIKDDECWCNPIKNLIFYFNIKNVDVEKEFQSLLDMPQKKIETFIKNFNYLQSTLSEENFIETISNSALENKVFLQQFDKSFYRRNWSDKIQYFYSNDDNLKLFAKILIRRGKKRLSDDDLFFMCRWLMGFGFSHWLKKTINQDEVFSGSEYIYEFFTSFDSEKFEMVFLNILRFENENVRLKILVEILEQLGCENEVKDSKRRQVYVELITAFKEWSKCDRCKILSITHRIEYILRIRRISIQHKRMFRWNHILTNSLENPFSELKGSRCIEEYDVQTQKQTAYYFLNVGTLFFDNSASKAIFWLERLANLGDLDCQIDLGKCYLNGVGVKKDIEKAKYWLNKAVEQGSLAAKDLIAKTQV